MADRKPESAPAEAGAKEAPQKPSGGGGIKAWLPLIITVIAMPALAYATTTFLLLPKLSKSMAGKAEPGPVEEPSHGPTGEKPDDAGKGGKTGKPGEKAVKQTVRLDKIIVNLRDTMGTRYLGAQVAVAGTAPNFKTLIEDNKDQLKDLADGLLSGKTISDLEKPGARNQIRTELQSVLNNALGGSIIKEIYLTELAIQ